MPRQDVRRARTRAALLDATRRVIADKGVDGTTIAAITEAADVGFGSFYNHFGSKDDAVEAVVASVVEDLGAALDALTGPMSDPAEVLAVSVRHVVGSVDRDPAWAWFIVRTQVANRLLATTLGARVVRDVRRGVEAGRFDADLHPVAPTAIGAVVQAAMRARLEGIVGADVTEAAAEQILRLVGVRSSDAKRIARRPLPELRA